MDIPYIIMSDVSWRKLNILQIRCEEGEGRNPVFGSEPGKGRCPQGWASIRECVASALFSLEIIFLLSNPKM